MDPGAEASAWLELAWGKSLPIEGTCSIGRGTSNQLILQDERVSRQHAVIRTGEDGECWIIDLGSANGTYVNQRRVNAQRLRDGDAITIGSCLIAFRSSLAREERPRHGDAGLSDTVHEMRPLSAWLFLADIQGSTGISRRLGPLQMERVFNEWLTRCEAMLQASGGILDKPLGDGFLAFWPIADRSAPDVARAVLEFRQFQSSSPLPFRMVLHVGVAFTGGQIASGMYRLFGEDVNFAFRMEVLAKTLGERCLLSEGVRDALASYMSPEPVGSHTLPGLEGTYAFFRL
jgi:adenylate cyclase